MLTKKQACSIKKEVSKGSVQLAAMLNALSDTGRLKIFRLLAKYEDLCVTDLANVLEVSVPAASQGLRIMELSGLVKKERRGQMICYVLVKNMPLVRALQRIVAGVHVATKDSSK
jgi:DNA-binding transcriptional ArsR family regulator